MSRMLLPTELRALYARGPVHRRLPSSKRTTTTPEPPGTGMTGLDIRRLRMNMMTSDPVLHEPESNCNP